MRDKTPFTSDYFLVFPTNRKIASGEMTFIQKSKRQLLGALAFFGLTLVSGLRLFNIHPLNTGLTIIIVTFMLSMGIFAFLVGYSALTTRRLEAGQFIDGKVVDCEGFWMRIGRGSKNFWLRLTYTFDTPAGTRVERTLTVQRQDLSPGAYKGFLPMIRLILYGEEQQEGLERAPEPGTLLKIRYVDDTTFRVM
jgi:hypothetical protein